MSQPELSDALVFQIKEALRACTTNAGVTIEARKYARAIDAMERSRSPHYKLMAVHIHNLGKYMRETIEARKRK